MPSEPTLLIVHYYAVVIMTVLAPHDPNVSTCTILLLMVMVMVLVMAVSITMIMETKLMITLLVSAS